MDAVLELIITPGSPVVKALLDEVVNELHALLVVEPLAGGEEAVFELNEGLLTALEAGQVVLAHQHHLHDNDDLLRVGLKSQEALLQVLTVLGERLASGTAKDLNLLSCELERSFLELETFARSVCQEESKVNVHDVALDVDQDVAVVSVLDVQNVAEQRVGRKTPAEVVTSLLVLLLLRATKLLLEVVDDPRVLAHLLLDTVNGQGVLSDLDDASSSPGGQDFVGLEPEVKLPCLEDLFKLADDLHGELFLSHVVVALHDDPEQLPSVKVAERRLLSYSCFLFLTGFVENSSFVFVVFLKKDALLVHGLVG